MANPLAPSDVSETMAAPLGDLIAAVGRGLAEAQQSLDMTTIETIKALYGGKDTNLDLMRQLGWQPTWYRIPELSAEITLSLSIGRTSTESGQGPQLAGPGRIRLYVSPMDASYTNRYEYDLQAASVIKFKIVPVPPSSETADRKIVPVVKGKKLSEVRQLLAGLGIPFEIAKDAAPGPDAPVWGTDPDEGELLAGGQQVTLLFYQPAGPASSGQ
jgi:hypothetical protein